MCEKLRLDAASGATYMQYQTFRRDYMAINAYGVVYSLGLQ